MQRQSTEDILVSTNNKKVIKMKALKLMLLALILCIVACGDDNDADNGRNEQSDKGVVELSKPSDHVINYFINTYHLATKKTVEDDTVSLLILNTGRSWDEIESLMFKYVPVIQSFDYIMDKNELAKYRKMYNDTCFNASGFCTDATLDTIASISVMCNESDIESDVIIKYNDIKKIVGVDTYSGRHVSYFDLDWAVEEPLSEFNKRKDNYLLEMGQATVCFPLPKEVGEYYYTTTYNCTNGRQFVMKDTISIK